MMDEFLIWHLWSEHRRFDEVAYFGNNPVDLEDHITFDHLPCPYNPLEEVDTNGGMMDFHDPDYMWDVAHANHDEK
jgi:hypothetical protein